MRKNLREENATPLRETTITQSEWPESCLRSAFWYLSDKGGAGCESDNEIIPQNMELVVITMWEQRSL